MKLFFSSRDIPELSDKTPEKRHELLMKAEVKLTAPEKLMLNLIKLIMLVPAFLMIARQEWLLFIVAVMFGIVVKVGFAQPLRHYFLRKHL